MHKASVDPQLWSCSGFDAKKTSCPRQKGWLTNSIKPKLGQRVVFAYFFFVVLGQFFFWGEKNLG